MAMTQRERYLATVNHERPDQLLYHFGCTADLRERLRKSEGLSPDDDMAEHFGIFAPASTWMKRPEDHPAPDFSRYFADEEIPEGARLDPNGVLHVPGSSFHFTHRVSPLRRGVSGLAFPPVEMLRVQGVSPA